MIANAENAAWITASMKARVHEYVRDPIYLSMIQRLREPVEDLAAFLTERRLDVQKVQVYPGSPEKRRALLQALPEAFPALLPTSSIAENIESMPLPRTRDRRFWRWPRTWDSVRSRPWPSATG